MRLPGRLVRGPVRPDRRTALRFASMRWAALPIIDRRWTAPLSAVALGFGLFVGVAIGPGTEGSFGTTTPMVVRIAPPGDATVASTPAAEGKPPAPPAGLAGGGNPGPQPAPRTPTADPPPPPASPPVTSPALETPFPSAPAPAPSSPGDPQPSEPEDQSDPTEGEPAVTTFTGTVVHLNPQAGSYSISSDDELIAVHAKNLPEVGEVLEIETRALANGTYAEDGLRKHHGRRGRSVLRGTVTFRDPRTAVYTVSAPGVSLLVRGGAQRQPPDVGESVEVETRVADRPESLPVSPPGQQGCGQPPASPKPVSIALEQVGLTVLPEAAEDESDEAAAATTTVEGIVEGVCRDSRKLIVSADDLRESGQDLALRVPASFGIAPLEPGQVVKLTVEVGASGLSRLTGIASDERREGADDADLIQP